MSRVPDIFARDFAVPSAGYPTRRRCTFNKE